MTARQPMSMTTSCSLDIGAAWTEQGRLSKASDVFDLHMDEIIAGQNDPDFDLRKVRAENLRRRRPLAHQSEYPLVIDSRGKIYRPGPEFRDGDMVGDPIAPGTVIGPAKVMSHPGEKPLRRGEILVARTTEPSWAPLFIKAAGVITEIGGPLQHGSIIIREYGLPCVSGLTDATKIIRDGDMLEVNGDDGLVKILKT